MFHPNQLRTGEPLPHRPDRSGRRLPRCRLHVQGRPDHLAPAGRIHRGHGTPDRRDRRPRDRPGSRVADPIARRSLTDMTLHPARASRAPAHHRQSLRRCHALAIVIAKLLVDAGMAIRPPTPCCSRDLITRPPVHRRLRRRRCRRGRGLLVGNSWADDVASVPRSSRVAVGAIGLLLLVVGRDPFASTASARSTNDGIGIIGAFTALYLLVIVAVAVARLPRHILDRSHGMTASTPLPRYAHRRGTRGFAAFVTRLPASSSSASAPSSCPSRRSTRPRPWLIPLTVAFGLAHFVAAYGLVRRRDWGGRLVGYLSAIGIGIAAYGLILTLTGMDPFGATSKLPSSRAWAEGLGLLIWMIGLWLVAARYAFRRSARVKPNPAAITYRPMAAAAIRPRDLSSVRDRGPPDPLRPRRRDALLRGARRLVLCRRRGGPGPAAALPGADLAAAERRLRLFLIQYWGGPRPTTTSAATRDCGCVTSRSRSARPSAIAGSSTCAPRSPPRRRRPTWPRSSSATSRWPPRRCATASDAGRRLRASARASSPGPGSRVPAG